MGNMVKPVVGCCRGGCRGETVKHVVGYMNRGEHVVGNIQTPVVEWCRGKTGKHVVGHMNRGEHVVGCMIKAVVESTWVSWGTSWKCVVGTYVCRS